MEGSCYSPNHFLKIEFNKKTQRGKTGYKDRLRRQDKGIRGLCI